MKVLHLGVNENKNSGKYLNKIEAKVCWMKGSWKWIVWKWRYKNVKMLKRNLIIWSKLQNIEKLIFGKLMSLFFLNEEVEEFTNKWSQNLVNVRSPSHLKEKTFEYCLRGINRLYNQFFIQTWWFAVSLS